MCQNRDSCRCSGKPCSKVTPKSESTVRPENPVFIPNATPAGGATQGTEDEETFEIIDKQGSSSCQESDIIDVNLFASLFNLETRSGFGDTACGRATAFGKMNARSWISFKGSEEPTHPPEPSCKDMHQQNWELLQEALKEGLRSERVILADKMGHLQTQLQQLRDHANQKSDSSKTSQTQIDQTYFRLSKSLSDESRIREGRLRSLEKKMEEKLTQLEQASEKHFKALEKKMDEKLASLEKTSEERLKDLKRSMIRLLVQQEEKLVERMRRMKDESSQMEQRLDHRLRRLEAPGGCRPDDTYHPRPPPPPPTPYVPNVISYGEWTSNVSRPNGTQVRGDRSISPAEVAASTSRS